MHSESVLDFQPGTLRMVLFTDGLIEASKMADEMYGIDHLIESAHNSINLPPKGTIEHIIKSQRRFVAMKQMRMNVVCSRLKCCVHFNQLTVLDSTQITFTLRDPASMIFQLILKHHIKEAVWYTEFHLFFWEPH